MVEKIESAEPFIGRFNGSVHNTSVDQSAGFGIVVRDDNGVLSGCMLVMQPLFGSGPLIGLVSGSDVSFEVTSSIGTIPTPVGHRSGGDVKGEYTVDQRGGSQQAGTFWLQKYNRKGLPKNLPCFNLSD